VREKRPREKRENRTDDDEAGYRLARNERGAAPGTRGEGNRAGTKKIRRKAGLIRALVAPPPPPPPPPPPELIDCMESAGKRERERKREEEGFLLFYCHTRGERQRAGAFSASG